MPPATLATRPVTSLDSGLAHRAAGGDSEAMNAIIDRHDARLRRMCRGILRDPYDADDAVQETWLRAVRALGGFAGDDLGAWLSVIARNESYRIAGRRARTPVPVEELPAVADPSSDPAELLCAHELGAAMVAAVAELPHSYRDAAARDLAGQTPAEIAEVLHLSAVATRVRTHRARKMLIGRLRENGLAAA
jgi:RNA polymerase sigma-70 factor, ECF subfamily